MTFIHSYPAGHDTHVVTWNVAIELHEDWSRGRNCAFLIPFRALQSVAHTILLVTWQKWSAFGQKSYWNGDAATTLRYFPEYGITKKMRWQKVLHKTIDPNWTKPPILGIDRNDLEHKRISWNMSIQLKTWALCTHSSYIAPVCPRIARRWTRGIFTSKSNRTRQTCRKCIGTPGSWKRNQSINPSINKQIYLTYIRKK